MATRKIFHCIVDDTALITNVSEIETWVSRGAITLVVPLYTLERLHVLKKDTSQIGTNARKAVKFLDRITSDENEHSSNPVVLQGPEEQYATWAEVETYFNEDTTAGEQTQATEDVNGDIQASEQEDLLVKRPDSAGGALSQMLLSKLNFAKNPAAASPVSTPPTSPSNSGPQSSRTSPEVKSATITTHDASPTPPALKPLINSVVWYMHAKSKGLVGTSVLFLTNAADTANLVRNFGIIPKNIHQLRISIGMEEQEVKNQDKFQKKHPSPPATAVSDPVPKPLFKYEEDDSDEEEVVFKPRGRGVRASSSARGSSATTFRSKVNPPRSPVISAPKSAPIGQSKPQIPTEEIDPDSFDRGGFARGSVPLVNTSNHSNGVFQGFPRGSPHRGNFTPAGPSRAGFRGSPSRGFNRGSARGRGQLFVP